MSVRSCALGASLLCAPLSLSAQQAVSPHGPVYVQVAPMDETVTQRLLPQLDALLHQLLRERRDMALDGVKVFESGDKFLPGKIASGLSYLLLDTPRTDPRFAGYLSGYRDIADLTLGDTNDSWGIYYYISALYSLDRAGLLSEAVRPDTLAALREKLDWRHFVDPKTLDLINLPNNYYGVAFSVARLRYLLGWEDAAASEALLARMLDHYRTYSGEYGFADETDGQGRFDRYSVLLIGEIAQRFLETGMTPSDEVLGWLRKSAHLMLLRANMTGEGWEYGRSIGAYGETAMLEVLTAAAAYDVLTPQERDMAYAWSSRIAARYADFWIDPRTGSVNLWDDGRRTDAYRGKHRILGENLSLARQYIYTDAIWNRLGYKGRAPSDAYAGWLATLPKSTFTWFARGDYDRGLLTVRDRGHVIGLPLINGAGGQHMHNPYFPIPFSAGMLSGSADATFPQLTPKFTLADGTVLMPLAWFRDVRVRQNGATTTITYSMHEMDRMGGDDAVRDDRMTVETRYVFAPGRITRTDRYSVGRPVEIARVELDFASFSGAARQQGTSIEYGAGEVTRFDVRGVTHCGVGPADAPEDRAPTGAFATHARCVGGPLKIRPGTPLTIGWTLEYR